MKFNQIRHDCSWEKSANFCVVEKRVTFLDKIVSRGSLVFLATDKTSCRTAEWGFDDKASKMRWWCMELFPSPNTTYILEHPKLCVLQVFQHIDPLYRWSSWIPVTVSSGSNPLRLSHLLYKNHNISTCHGHKGKGWDA